MSTCVIFGGAGYIGSTCVIFGGADYIGTHLARYLKSLEHRRLIDHRTSGPER
jgi:nucleoside-diphosphate-sugar epimerase